MDELRQPEKLSEPVISAAGLAGPDSFSSSGKNVWWIPVLFLLLSLFRNHTLFTMIGNAYYFDVFTLGVLSLAAVALLFADFRRLSDTLLRMGKLPLTALLIFSGIVFWHFFMNGRLSIQHLGEGFRWISIPLLVCVYYDSFRKILPWFFSFLCLWNLVFSLIEASNGKEYLFGISGNVNWNAAIIVITTPFLLYGLWDSLKVRWKLPAFIPILAVGVILACSVYLIFRLDSRAGYLSISALLLLFGWLRLSDRFRKITLFGGVAFGVVCAVLFSLFFTDRLGRGLAEEDRLTFYEGALNMIADHPLAGVGNGAFEDTFVRYRPLEYFFMKNAAPRSDHPHNHFLYIACCFGLIGLGAWLCLLLLPLWRFFMKLYRREPVSFLSKLYLSALLYTLLHSSLDLVFFVWPNALVSLTILGLFWRECFVGEEKNLYRPGIGLRVFSACLAVLIGAWALFAAARSAYSSCSARRLMQVSMPLSEMVSSIYRTARLCPAEYSQNYAMLYLTEKILNYPELAIYLADIMRRSNIENYPGVHMGRGNAMLQMGDLKGAYESYRREAENFPIAILPMHNMILTAEKMGDPDLVRKLRENLEFRLSSRNINPKMYESILKNPQYDLVPWKIPKENGGPGGQYGFQK